ncbi:MAG: hypothetical protein DRO99_05400, partial [Candidatus Aenigmatarchaeota archaeon]
MAKAKHRVAVIIPAYEEGHNIAGVIEKVNSYKKRGIIHKILVIDDASPDNTSEEAERAGAEVIRHII